MNKTLAYIALASTISILVIPNVIFLFAGDIFERSDPNNLFILPAKYSFAIFFLIPIGFIALGVYQALPAQMNVAKYKNARKYIILNALANNLCIVSIVYESLLAQVLSTILVLYTLIRLSVILDLGRPSANKKEAIFVKIPLSIYFGWFTLLTPITLTFFLYDSLNWNNQALPIAEFWTVFVLLTSILVVIYQFLQKRVTLTYILVIIWGLFAIFIANLDSSLGSKSVAYSALGLSVGLLVTYFLVERQQMELSKMSTELTALKNQVNPHFLFNNLNTLSNLIPLESEKAHSYLDELAKFYRFIVSQGEEHLIPLRQELAGVNHYISILKERFGDNLQIEVDCEQNLDKTIPPLSLQLLIENAVKHNVISEDHRLWIKIYTAKDSNQLTVENNVNERLHVLESTGIGLKNIRQRYQHFTKQKVKVEAQKDRFRVSLPLISSRIPSNLSEFSTNVSNVSKV